MYNKTINEKKDRNEPSTTMKVRALDFGQADKECVGITHVSLSMFRSIHLHPMWSHFGTPDCGQGAYLNKELSCTKNTFSIIHSY